jgi:hypothetical protein
MQRRLTLALLHRSANVQKRFAVGRGLRSHLEAKHRAEFADENTWAAAAAQAQAQALASLPPPGAWIGNPQSSLL